jgi:hypothetical protein
MSKNKNEPDTIKFLKAIERFNFLVFRVTKRRNNTGNSHFYGKAHEYYCDEISIRELTKCINEYTSENKYGYNILEFSKYIEIAFESQCEGFYSWNGLKYLLYEYEVYLQNISSGKEKISWNYINKSDCIEHIYPQNPKPNSWKLFYKSKKIERYHLTHSLGNLTLLSISKNSELSNESFEYKKKHKDKNGVETGYFNGSYSEIEIAQCVDWLPLSIYERGVKILAFMEDRWDIEIKNKDGLLGLEFLL